MARVVGTSLDGGASPDLPGAVVLCASVKNCRGALFNRRDPLKAPGTADFALVSMRESLTVSGTRPGFLFQWRQVIVSQDGPPSTTRHILLTLSLHMESDGGGCFPGTRLLARETGLSRKSVMHHLRVAEETGWIRRTKIKRRGQSNGWVQHIYTPTVPPNLLPVDHQLRPNLVNQGAQVDGERGEPDDLNLVNEGHRRSSLRSSLKDTSDPRADHPAIKAIRELQRRYPDRILWDDLIKSIGDTPDFERLRACRKEWIARGYNGNSLKWVTDWYVKGISKRPGPMADDEPRGRNRVVN